MNVENPSTIDTLSPQFAAGYAVEMISLIVLD